MPGLSSAEDVSPEEGWPILRSSDASTLSGPRIANITELTEGDLTVTDHDERDLSNRVSAVDQGGEEHIDSCISFAAPNQDGHEVDLWELVKLAGVLLITALLILGLFIWYMRWMKGWSWRKR